MQTRMARDWPQQAALLDTAEPGDETDESIDELADAALAFPTPDAAPVFVCAIAKALHPMTCRSAALALALCAAPDDSTAVDALVSAYRRGITDAYLGPALLEALGLLALRHPLGRTEASGALLRLTPDDTCFLLVKGAQVLGRLDSLRPTPELRDQLRILAHAEDLAVQAEAYQQLALIALSDALLASDRLTLYERLAAARAAFARAEIAEENRPDALVFVSLLDMLLAFRSPAAAKVETMETLEARAADVKVAVACWGTPAGFGYRAPNGDIVAARVLGIADALVRAGRMAKEAEAWTNLDAALTDLAALLAVIRSTLSIEGFDQRLGTALSAISDTVVAPHLGPVILQAVGRLRLSRVRERYVAEHGEDTIAHGLGMLEEAAAAGDFPEEDALTWAASPQVARLAARLGHTPKTLLQRLMSGLERESSDRLARELGLGPVPLPVDRPSFYGGDPHVDEAVRPLLGAIRDRLGVYSPIMWDRLVATVESIVQFASYVRDAPPAYTLCIEDSGKGQSASERDLQEDLFSWLRRTFGRAATYEHHRLGGGRPDTGVEFPECRFPIEVKHEFGLVTRDAVRDRFLTQADQYASATDRVAFLVILDLRETNAAGHRERRVPARRSLSLQEPLVALYSLTESFWVDGLRSDPQIHSALQNAVIVCLIPGNRSRPSSATMYSRRPKRPPQAGH